MDIIDSPGHYQNVVLTYNGAGHWELTRFDVVGDGIFRPTLESVEVIKTQNIPIQVFLKAKGWLGVACGEIDTPDISFENDTFKVSLQTEWFDYVQGGCFAALDPFYELIPLPVYGLEAGTYNYHINGTSGTFVLDRDNVLQLTDQ